MCWAEERKQGDRLENDASSWLQQRPVSSSRKVTAASRHPRYPRYPFLFLGVAVRYEYDLHLIRTCFYCVEGVHSEIVGEKRETDRRRFLRQELTRSSPRSGEPATGRAIDRGRFWTALPKRGVFGFSSRTRPVRPRASSRLLASTRPSSPGSGIWTGRQQAQTYSPCVATLPALSRSLALSPSRARPLLSLAPSLPGQAHPPRAQRVRSSSSSLAARHPLPFQRKSR